MNSRSRRKTGIFFLQIFILLGVFGIVLVVSPFQVRADSNEETPVPINTATPLPSFTPAPAVPIETAAENVINIPVIQNSNPEDAVPLTSAEEQEAAAQTPLIESLFGVNQCLIGAIILGVLAISLMVVYYVVQYRRV